MTPLEVSDLTKNFGAVVRGLNPAAIDSETTLTLCRLFDERGALVFPALDIDFEGQDRLCRMLIGRDGASGKRQNDPFYVSNKEEGGFAPYGRLLFHADMMWHATPFQVLSLYAMDVQPGSAGTALTSSEKAWATLPEDLRKRIKGLEVRHVTGTVFARGGADLLRAERSTEHSTVKPICINHPRTGKPLLYVSQQSTREIIGMAQEASEALLQELFDHLYSPELVYEHHWTDGDLLVFDNLTMQHARKNVDANGPTRTLRKVIAPVPDMPYEKPKFDKKVA